MVRFQTRGILPGITEIRGILYERMYLVEGRERAALIDTGSGFGSLRRVTDGITDKPVTVLLTHAHVDHAMGASEYDTVFMSPEDLPVFRRHAGRAFRLDGLNHTRYAGEFEPSDYLESPDPDRFLPLREGDVFDLGGVTLRAYACPGHTPGSMVFLDEEDRVLFTGDAVSNATFLLDPESLTVEDYMHALIRLRDRTLGSFDRVLESHGTGELPPNILEDVIRVCRQIMEGDTDRIPYSFRGYGGFLAKRRLPHSLCREDGGSGNVEYDENRVFSAGLFDKCGTM